MPKKEITKSNLPLLLMILDGWGISGPNRGNAVTLAKTPNIDSLLMTYPNTSLHAHGQYAGLPEDQVGNSEAGHMNIGAGRLVEQDSVIISRSIKDGTFFKNSAFLGAIRHVKKMNSKLHVMGMISNGQSPHTDPGHLYALLQMLKNNGIDNIFLHLFTDGRDSPKYASLNLINDLEEKLSNSEKVVTIMGRYYAMDRKKKWSSTEKAYNALVLGEGLIAKNAQSAITKSYNSGQSDEYIEPYVIVQEEPINSRIEDGDSIIFFNLRSDRARQLAKAFVQTDFNQKNPGSFFRKKQLEHLYFVAMTDFGPDLDDILTAFPSIDLKNTLTMALGDLRQLYIAETEKYAHVTYFFNGGYSGKVAAEDQFVVASPDVKSYDVTPLMSSKELSEIVISNLSAGPSKKPKYDFTLLNFAAPDMIGHTGNLAAGIECCEKIDDLVGKIVKAYLGVEGTVIITADHGNIEEMINLETGEIDTEHSIFPVPFILIGENVKGLKLRSNGILSDIAPTVLDLLKIKKPKEMNRKSLIV